MNEFGKQWRRLARQTRWKTNLGWWLHGLAGPLAAFSLVIGCLVLWLRRSQPEWVEAHFAPVAAGVVLACGFWSWLRQREKFITEAQGLVLIESRLHLHNALSTAADGRGPWPAPLPYPPAVTRWNWPNTLVPPLAALTFLLAGLFLPVPAPALSTNPEEPPAWKAIEAELRQLEEQKAVDPKSLEETRRVIEQLRAAGPDQWFNHASLEATDQLKQMHERSMKGLERNLRRAGEAASGLGADAPPMSPSARENRKEQFQKAMENMRAAGLKPNQELWDKLRQMDPEQLGQLNRMQMDELLSGMDAVAEALREARRKKGGVGEGGEGEGEEADGAGQGEGGEGDQQGDGPGKGGVSRGPGTSKDLFGQDATDLQANQPQALRPRDLSRSQPGELLDLQDGTHEVDEVSPGLQGGGAARTEGGGAGAWQDSLHPREQEALKRFFE